jgi:predicted small secreted protein
MSPVLISKVACDAPVKSPLKLFAVTAGISVILLAFASSSCATTRGFGRDVQTLGDQIEESARR